MYSFVNWGQLGAYLVHPDHMNVRLPSNVEDVNIRAGYNFDQPLLGPVTVTTFLIARLLIANIIQELTDAVNKAELSDVEFDYSTVMIFDKKINDTYKALPAYLHYETDPEYLKRLFMQRPYLDRQRKLLLFGLHNSLALLHRRFLARSYQDERYTYSRVVCLQSTRIVLEMQDSVRGSLFWRAWLVVYHVFIATTTLTMDYVYNRRDPVKAAERKAEILRCYHILEECGQQDPEVKQGMESLKWTMQDWKSRTTDTRPPSRNGPPRRSTPGYPFEPQTENWPTTSRSSSRLGAQPQQPHQMISQPVPNLPGVLGGTSRWFRDVGPSQGPQHHTTEQVAPESLPRSVEDDLDWQGGGGGSRNQHLPLSFDLPPAHVATASANVLTDPDGLSMVPPSDSPMTTTAQWMQTGSPNLWLPGLDADGNSTYDFPWDDMLRDFGVQQSRAGF